MKLSIFAFLLVILGAICSTSASHHYKKPLKIVHKWKPHYGHGYGHGHGYHGKKVGYSKRYQHMSHGKHYKHY
ncbi:hypothetical protein TYRP_023608 [Tyrophagus putrescentiae]|nr:hypothetical protein TYRP_012364 [Tyrophagus putrescentiae]KAH9410479.1 hypothetical protein TYRP_023608 [Tyrophagus putrescentiae]